VCVIGRQTEVDDVPLALLAFQGRLAAGVGKALRLYNIGKKKLLRKVENKVSLIRLNFPRLMSCLVRPSQQLLFLS